MWDHSMILEFQKKQWEKDRLLITESLESNRRFLEERLQANRKFHEDQRRAARIWGICQAVVVLALAAAISWLVSGR